MIDDYRREIYDRQSRMFSLLFKMTALVLISFAIVLVAKPIQGILFQYERILQAEATGMERLPELKRQIVTLEKQIASVSTSSIEARLGIVESAINTGDLSVEDIATLQELRSDFKVLKSYMFESPEDLVKLKTLQRDYAELNESKSNYMTKDQIMREVSFLQNMFYIVLGLLGILVSLVGGSWWFTSRKSKVNSPSEKTYKFKNLRSLRSLGRAKNARPF